MKRIPATVILLLILNGCATTAYVPPQGANTANITGTFVRNSTFDWEYYAVRAVDGAFLPNPFFGQLAEVRSGIAAGHRQILVEAKFNRGFGTGGPYQALIPLRFEVRAGAGTFRINGAVRENLIEAWVEDAATSQKLTSPVSSTFAPVAPAPGVVPIIIPSR